MYDIGYRYNFSVSVPCVVEYKCVKFGEITDARIPDNVSKTQNGATVGCESMIYDLHHKRLLFTIQSSAPVVFALNGINSNEISIATMSSHALFPTKHTISVPSDRFMVFPLPENKYLVLNKSSGVLSECRHSTSNDGKDKWELAFVVYNLFQHIGDAVLSSSGLIIFVFHNESFVTDRFDYICITKCVSINSFIRYVVKIRTSDRIRICFDGY